MALVIHGIISDELGLFLQALHARPAIGIAQAHEQHAALAPTGLDIPAIRGEGAVQAAEAFRLLLDLLLELGVATGRWRRAGWRRSWGIVRRLEWDETSVVLGHALVVGRQLLLVGSAGSWVEAGLVVGRGG